MCSNRGRSIHLVLTEPHHAAVKVESSPDSVANTAISCAAAALMSGLAMHSDALWSLAGSDVRSHVFRNSMYSLALSKVTFPYTQFAMLQVACAMSCVDIGDPCLPSRCSMMRRGSSVLDGMERPS